MLHFRENLPFCWQLQHIGEGIPNEGGEFLRHSWEGPADLGAEEKIKRLGWVEGGTAEVLRPLEHIQRHDTVRDAEVRKLAKDGKDRFAGGVRRVRKDLAEDRVLFPAQGGTVFCQQLRLSGEIFREWVAGKPALREMPGGKAVDHLGQVENIAV